MHPWNMTWLTQHKGMYAQKMQVYDAIILTAQHGCHTVLI